MEQAVPRGQATHCGQQPMVRHQGDWVLVAARPQRHHRVHRCQARPHDANLRLLGYLSQRLAKRVRVADVASCPGQPVGVIGRRGAQAQHRMVERPGSAPAASWK